MDDLVLFGTLVVFSGFLIYLSGWFSSTETAMTHLTSSDLARMKRERRKNIGYVLILKRNMELTLVTLLIMNNVVNILLSSLAALMANILFDSIGVSIVIGTITFLVILFGEIAPKNMAIARTKKMALGHARTLFYLSRLIRPLAWAFLKIARLLMRIVGVRPPMRLSLTTDEVIMDLVDLHEEEGRIKPIERDIIHKVFLFGDRRIEEVMVPMDMVFTISGNPDVGRAKSLIRKEGFTRVPVVDEKGQVRGILHSKDLLDVQKGTIHNYLRNPLVIPSGTDITEAFTLMKRIRSHMAIVRDKEGKHIGIATLEDIIEELVGEIQDEHYEIKYGTSE